MKVPKQKSRYCPKCKKHTEHKIELAKKRTMGTAHPQSHGSRAKWRHLKGMGNSGRYSRPPGGGKMYGKKQTKKTDFRYTCSQCKKTWTGHADGIRLKKVEFQWNHYLNQPVNSLRFAAQNARTNKSCSAKQARSCIVWSAKKSLQNQLAGKQKSKRECLKFLSNLYLY